jgi:hypothetical protein
MFARKLHRFFISSPFTAFFLFHLFSAHSVSAYTDAKVSALKTQIANIEIRVAYAQTQTRTLQLELMDLTSQIDKTKKEQTRNYSWFKSLGLNRLLAKAEEKQKVLASKLENLRFMSHQIVKLKWKLIDRYEDILDQLAKEIYSKKPAGKTQVLPLLKEYSHYSRQKERVEIKLLAKEETEKKRFFIVESTDLDGVDEINEKIDILRDLKDKIEANIDKVRRITADLKRREKLLREVKQFKEEIQFFSDDFFVMRSKSSSDSEDADSEEDSDSENDESADETSDGQTSGNGTSSSTDGSGGSSTEGDSTATDENAGSGSDSTSGGADSSATDGSSSGDTGSGDAGAGSTADTSATDGATAPVTDATTDTSTTDSGTSATTDVGTSASETGIDVSRSLIQLPFKEEFSLVDIEKIKDLSLPEAIHLLTQKESDLMALKEKLNEKIITLQKDITALKGKGSK